MKDSTFVVQPTPGPWRMGADGYPLLTMGDCLLYPQIWSDDTRIGFCECHNMTIETAQANARLIAAAPELYAALEILLTFDGISAREKARAALAQARGE